jgi:glycosyltransferase involved in cell wall biosynthesis
MKVWIVMPAYNEERSIGEVLDALHREGWQDIIVVNDGSHDRTAEIARAKGAFVVSHERNLGLGAALRTGLARARELGADYAVTFDADGQHDPKAIRRMIEALKDADFVVGVRYFVNAPLHKRFGNLFLNLITHMLGGILTDSQSGFRAFNRRSLKQIEIRSDRYAVSSELIIRARQKRFTIKEVPVKCYFTPYSKVRGTTIASGILIFWNLLKLRVRGELGSS